MERLSLKVKSTLHCTIYNYLINALKGQCGAWSRLKKNSNYHVFLIKKNQNTVKHCNHKRLFIRHRRMTGGYVFKKESHPSWQEVPHPPQSGLDEGTPWSGLDGVSPPSSGLDGGTPTPCSEIGRQSSYTSGGVPLPFTQEDFLVYFKFPMFILNPGNGTGYIINSAQTFLRRIAVEPALTPLYSHHLLKARNTWEDLAFRSIFAFVSCECHFIKFC